MGNAILPGVLVSRHRLVSSAHMTSLSFTCSLYFLFFTLFLFFQAAAIFTFIIASSELFAHDPSGVWR